MTGDTQQDVDSQQALPILSDQVLEPYKYHQLSGSQSIRLIKASRGRENDEIACQIVESSPGPGSTDPPVPYHTLSYTWGSPFEDIKGQAAPSLEDDIWAQRMRIRLSGPGADSGYLLVTRNLHDFLEEFTRHPPDGVEHLWIDAISVNQEDLDERAAQVSIMDQIYLNCESVIVWLGVDDRDAAAAFQMMSHLNMSRQDFRPKLLHARQGRPASDILPTLYSSVGLPNLSSEFIMSCAMFLQRSWLFRIWTFQEYILPQDGILWCGHLRAPLVCLSNFIVMISNAWTAHYHPVLRNIHGHEGEKTPSPIIYDRIDRVLNSRLRPYWGRRLGSIEICRGFPCSDPRDKIYGLLGLVENIPHIDIDYSKPANEIYREWALKMGPEVAITSLEDPSTRLTEGLPSWVPDYRVFLDPHLWRNRGGNKVYAAGGKGDKVSKLLESSDGRVLVVSGFHEDSVAALGASYDEMIYGTGMIESLDLLEKYFVLWDAPTAKESLIEEFWRVLIANLPGNSTKAPKSEVYGLSFRNLVLFLVASNISTGSVHDGQFGSVKALVENIKEATGSHHLPDWEEILHLAAALDTKEANTSIVVKNVVEAMTEYLDSLDAMFSRRRFFLASKKRLCIGPQVVLPGDCVFVFQGYDYPFLLRKSDSGRYRILGEIYVSGIMFGEALVGRVFQSVEIE